MYSKNRTSTFFALLIIGLIAFSIYQSSQKPVSVVIQAGHEGRTSGNTGAVSKQYKETDWNTLVANEVAKQLRAWEIDVKRVPAKVTPMRAKIAIAIHFDSAKSPCHSGASIGYPNTSSYQFSKRWKALYSAYFPFKWHDDNFTENLKNYYAYRKIYAEKFLVLELGEITCNKQASWLHTRLQKIAHLIAYAIATELGKEVKKPAW